MRIPRRRLRPYLIMLAVLLGGVVAHGLRRGPLGFRQQGGDDLGRRRDVAGRQQPPTPELPVFLDETGRRARRLRAWAVAAVVCGVLVLGALVDGALGLGDLPQRHGATAPALSSTPTEQATHVGSGRA